MGNDHKLKKVKDEATILSLLSNTKETNSEVYVWKLIGNTKHLGQVRIESIRKSRGDFCIIPSGGQDRIVEELLSNQSYIDLFIPESAMLLRCNIKSTDAPVRYYLQIPTYIAQVERRQSFRLQTYASSEVKVSFSKTVEIPKTITQHFFKDCFDVSSGGFSFFVSRMEMKFFNGSDLISSLEIKAGDWATNASAEIAAVREVVPDEFNGFSYKVWRVSCRFTKMDQISKKYLEKYIFERIKDKLHAINE